MSTPENFTDEQGVVRLRGRFGGGGSQPPVTFEGTDPDTVPLSVEGATNQNADVFAVSAQSGADKAVKVGADGAGNIVAIQLTASDGADIGTALLEPGKVTLTGPVQTLWKVPLSEPSDSALNAFGKVIVWLTDTAGSAKLNFKTLDSDEAVVKGSVNLTP